MTASNRKFRDFRRKPQPDQVQKATGMTVDIHAVRGFEYLQKRAERGRQKAARRGQTSEDMIRSILDKAESVR